MFISPLLDPSLCFLESVSTLLFFFLFYVYTRKIPQLYNGFTIFLLVMQHIKQSTLKKVLGIEFFPTDFTVFLTCYRAVTDCFHHSWNSVYFFFVISPGLFFSGKKSNDLPVEIVSECCLRHR